MFNLVPQLPVLEVQKLEIDEDFYMVERLLGYYPESFPQFKQNWESFPSTGFKVESWVSSIDVTHGDEETLVTFEQGSYLVTSTNGKYALVPRGSGINDGMLDDVPFQLLVPGKAIRAGS